RQRHGGVQQTARLRGKDRLAHLVREGARHAVVAGRELQGDEEAEGDGTGGGPQRRPAGAASGGCGGCGGCGGSPAVGWVRQVPRGYVGHFTAASVGGGRVGAVGSPVAGRTAPRCRPLLASRW